MKRKIYIKNGLLVGILIISVIAIIGATSYVAESYLSIMSGDINSYVLRDMASSSLPVANEVEKKTVLPYNGENVKIITDYYDFKASTEEQEKSLILYENTYMPNTGILYGSDELFDVVSIYDGKVKDVTEDDVFGTIVEIEYANNFLCKYSSLSSVEVAAGDEVASGEIIGHSGKNKIVSNPQNMLLFELIYNGVNVNPKEYFDKNLEEMR